MVFSLRFLDEIKNRASLAEVVGRRVRLIKKGREFLGLCPFHNEKTPSFTVNEEKGFYHWDGNISPVDILTTENLNEPAFYGNQITLKAGNTEKTYILDNSGSYFTCNQLISNISDFEKLIRPVHDLITANIELMNIHFYQLKLINPEEDVINHKYTPLWTSG